MRYSQIKNKEALIKIVDTGLYLKRLSVRVPVDSIAMDRRVEPIQTKILSHYILNIDSKVCIEL